jgi:hypothetical protein
VGLDQWLYICGFLSVSGTRAVAVWYLNEARAWYKSSGCIVVCCVPCLVLE